MAAEDDDDHSSKTGQGEKGKAEEEPASAERREPITTDEKEHDDKPEDDANLRMLNARRMVELRKRMESTLLAKKKAEEEKASAAKKPKPLSDRELVLRALVERGDEVLTSAEAGYPRETTVIVARLASLIREGKIGSITGGELLQFFRSLGMRVSVKTSISVEEHGKFVDLAEKFKRENQ